MKLLPVIVDKRFHIRVKIFLLHSPDLCFHIFLESRGIFALCHVQT